MFSLTQIKLNEGLSFEPLVSRPGRLNGALQFLRLVEAFAHSMKGNNTAAQEALTKLDALPDKHVFQWPIRCKAEYLRKLVGMEIKESYVQVDVPARQKAKIFVKIPADSDHVVVEWDWALKDFSINFLALFTSCGSTSTQSVQSIDQHQAGAGPVEGKFEVSEPGTLELIFDNSFSMLRSKTVHCRVQPSSLEVTQESAS